MRSTNSTKISCTVPLPNKPTHRLILISAQRAPPSPQVTIAIAHHITPLQTIDRLSLSMTAATTIAVQPLRGGRRLWEGSSDREWWWWSVDGVLSHPAFWRRCVRVFAEFRDQNQWILNFVNSSTKRSIVDTKEVRKAVVFSSRYYYWLLSRGRKDTPQHESDDQWNSSSQSTTSTNLQVFWISLHIDCFLLNKILLLRDVESLLSHNELSTTTPEHHATRFLFDKENAPFLRMICGRGP